MVDYSHLPTLGACLWCKETLLDGSTVSGFQHGPDPMGTDGDFGCDSSPEATREACGSHFLDGKESVRRLFLLANRAADPKSPADLCALIGTEAV